MQIFCNSQSSLHKLSVLGTEVTHAGIRFAIEHLPVLKELTSSTDILEVFFRICKETRESKKCSLTKFSMRTMIQTQRNIVPYKKGSVSLMVDKCPLIDDLFVGVYDEGFTNEEFLGEKNLK